MGSDKDWLAEVKERAETATPEPWGIEECAGANLITTPGVMVAETVSDPDASFIASARADVPMLVAVVEAADALAAAIVELGLDWELRPELAAYRHARGGQP